MTQNTTHVNAVRRALDAQTDDEDLKAAIWSAIGPLIERADSGRWPVLPEEEIDAMKLVNAYAFATGDAVSRVRLFPASKLERYMGWFPNPTVYDAVWKRIWLDRFDQVLKDEPEAICTELQQELRRAAQAMTTGLWVDVGSLVGRGVHEEVTSELFKSIWNPVLGYVAAACAGQRSARELVPYLASLTEAIPLGTMRGAPDTMIAFCA